ncbi:hypothetical protein HO908_03415 [Streptococcus suis]|nr:hypothetical protein [Streptococcus suis]
MVDELIVVAPVEEPQVETSVEDSIITAKGDSVTHELPELDITAILSQGHILPTEILPETTVTPTVSHLVGGAAAGGSAEAYHKELVTLNNLLAINPQDKLLKHCRILDKKML